VIKYAYATHFLEVARDAVVESQAFPEALQTLLNSLHVLCYRELPPEFISRVYEIRMLSLAGFAPALDCCSVCGKPAPFGGGARFAAGGDGLVCGSAECLNSSGRTVAISTGAIRAVKYVTECGSGDIFNFKINGVISAELAAAIPAYLNNKFGRIYDKSDEAERYRVFEREVLTNYGKG
jgi:DNA repair protein RecO (recombination protein O)